jgi:hypothetical protein
MGDITEGKGEFQDKSIGIPALTIRSSQQRALKMLDLVSGLFYPPCFVAEVLTHPEFDVDGRKFLTTKTNSKRH